MMNKNLFLTLVLLFVGSWVQAKTLTLGVKGGYAASLEYANQRPEEERVMQGGGLTTGGGFIVYSDIFITETFALTPEFSMHFMQGNKSMLLLLDGDPVAGMPPVLLLKDAKWSSSEFGLGFLAKFYAKWFYAGVGLAATHTKAAKLVSASVADMPVPREMINTMPTKSSWGCEGNVELGVDVPCGPGQFNISSRTSLNMINFYRYVSSAINTNTNMLTGNMVRTGLYMGYSFNLI